MAIKSLLTAVLVLGSLLPSTLVSGYAFVAKNPITSARPSLTSAVCQPSRSPSSSRSSLKMVDQNVLMGVGVGVASFAAGIGLVAFTEVQGERAKNRGGGLSEGMSTRITGGLMEDVEVSSVSDLGSLTNQLEMALRQSGGADDKAFEIDEEERKRIAEEAEDGW
jgi:hypothetical protein